MSDELAILAQVPGEGQAEMLRGLIEAQGIPVLLSQEGAGKAYGLTVGPLGTVQLLVPVELLKRAQQVLEAYEAGEFESESGSDAEAT